VPARVAVVARGEATTARCSRGLPCLGRTTEIRLRCSPWTDTPRRTSCASCRGAPPSTTLASARRVRLALSELVEIERRRQRRVARVARPDKSRRGRALTEGAVCFKKASHVGALLRLGRPSSSNRVEGRCRCAVPLRRASSPARTQSFLMLEGRARRPSLAAGRARPSRARKEQGAYLYSSIPLPYSSAALVASRLSRVPRGGGGGGGVSGFLSISVVRQPRMSSLRGGQPQ
jgi:hypothetical protein